MKKHLFELTRAGVF